jgi:undecaprenyl-diphosphatase
MAADPIEHRRWIAGAAATALVGSAIVARQHPPPGWELALTEWINGAPDRVALMLYPVMQLGTLLAPIVLAGGILLVTRDRLLAAATLLVGLATWFAAKGVKELFGRGRPPEYLPDIDVREGAGTGLGFVSGHSSVAAATAVIAIAVVPRRFRPLVVVLAGLVGVARVVHGVHLPADVVGGWAFGTLLGLGAVAIVDHVRRRPPHTT